MATEKQLAAIAKAREAKNQASTAGKQSGTSGGGGGGMGFENPQQLGQQAGELWVKGFNSAIQSGLKTALGSFRNQSTSSSSGTRGGTSAQHAKAGRKGGKASHSGGGGGQSSTG